MTLKKTEYIFQSLNFFKDLFFLLLNHAVLYTKLIKSDTRDLEIELFGYSLDGEFRFNYKHYINISDWDETNKDIDKIVNNFQINAQKNIYAGATLITITSISDLVNDNYIDYHTNKRMIQIILNALIIEHRNNLIDFILN